MTTRVPTWRTTKVDGGFEYHVYSFGYQVPEETLKLGVCATRAQAKGFAQRWLRRYKAQQRKQAAA